MGKTISKQEKDILNKIRSLTFYFKENKDEDAAEKARDLGVKLYNSEYAIAFCGHFSAGKSSMINRLVGASLLPSSPIPTSANLVKIRSGEDYAKVLFKNEKPRLYTAPYDYEKVKTYCKNGDEIKSIEISDSRSSFPEDVVIMDTPGIDSTDDAHRIATESALHLADVVFYVMDYNHVQSEPNFLFTKELTQAGKETYLVINQIDKHREEQLSFSDFKESVRNAFASWGVHPAGIYYTSLKDTENQNNQFLKLQELLNNKIQQRSELLPISVYRSLVKLTEDHLQSVKEKDQDELAFLKTMAENIPEEDQNHLYEKLEKQEQLLESFERSTNQFKTAFENEVEKTVKSAYLMPFQTRELAKSYLESKQSGFKVGLFFTRQKTLEEQGIRLERFYQDLQEKVTSQLDWQLKELFNQYVKQEGVHHPRLQELIQGISVPFTKELLELSVKEGARLSGEYVLNYTEDVANQIRKLAKSQIEELKDTFLNLVAEKMNQRKQSIEADYQQLKEFEEVYKKISIIEKGYENSKEKISTILSGIDQENIFASDENIFANVEEEVEIIKNSASQRIEETKAVATKSAYTQSQELDSALVQHTSPANKHLQLVEKMRSASTLLKDVPGLIKTSSDLKQKAERISVKEFTVALFGAFSAGKSSFANALLGENILPVSPNPTTAAINKIKPVSDQNPHGKVIVKLKDEQELLSEVKRALHLFGEEVDNFSEAFAKLQELNEEEGEYNPIEKTYFSFLKAFSSGFKENGDKLGQSIHSDLKEFRDYVAQEEKSCFVEWIEVYYDCPLTREGITLVDTPGADSIHARHTGVAFDYIKNSDAILFVTYYNHAFSRADREFLIQLGRVKDTFALDKMFFIVNAIDLADSEEEMGAVMDYVHDQLINYGIRKPSLFPVSSLKALEEKTRNKSEGLSRIEHFEKAFYSFITNDLMDIALSAGEADLSQAASRLENMVASAEEDISVKEEKRNNINKEKALIYDKLTNFKSTHLQKRMSQEAHELVYYINQRVFLRFSDFFKESFNPSVLKDDGRNLKKALNSALEDLLESMGYDFAQEMRATTLRVEGFLAKLLQESYDQVIQEISMINKEITFSRFELEKLPGIDFKQAFETLEKAQFKKPLSTFKNPKAFFEKNEKKVMAEQLELLLKAPAESYLDREKQRLTEHYQKLLLDEFNRLIKEITYQTEEYYIGVSSALNNEIPVERLKEILQNIK